MERVERLGGVLVILLLGLGVSQLDGSRGFFAFLSIVAERDWGEHGVGERVLREGGMGLGRKSKG